MVGVAQGLKGGGISFEGCCVGEDVVAGSNAVEGDIGGSRGGGGNLGDGDVPAVELIEGGEHHGGAALLALTAVAGDVRGGDDAFLKQVAGDVGFVLPAVEPYVAVPAHQGRVVGNGAACGIENQAAAG